MKKTLLILLLLLSCLALSAQYFTGFSLQSYKIKSLYPTSFRSLKGRVELTVGNTADTRSLSNVYVVLYRSGKKFAIGSCDDVTLRQGTASYIISGQGVLAEGVSTWDAIVAAFTFKASDYTFDFQVDITHPDGHVDHVVREGRPVSHYMQRFR